ncbi:SdpI family protein [Mucilaginibacter sp. HMF5004]|uniref:SdpI family protein n=1 Tax=Mucilaginibacter rivuli TaxID=2857527 RepID=UPI001C5F7E74|nr:SdpI family protein [Mucilaginibacter rivuli]MBW4888352.1 SdpI family protein [Mucilaginibacter rivuli]
MTTFQIINLIIGPQLIGIIMLLVGFIQYRFPPKHINKYYGYRMGLALKNQQTWDAANSYSGKLMMKIGLICIVGGIALALILGSHAEPAMPLLAMASGIASPIVMMVMTEKYMDKTFDKDGNALL